MRFLAAMLLLFQWVAAASNEYADADNLEQAFGMVFAEKTGNDFIRRQCTQWHPDLSAAFDSHFYAWETTNSEELTAIEILSADRNPTVLSMLESVAVSGMQEIAANYADESPVDRRAFCLRAATFASGEDGSIQSRTPLVSGLLRQFLVENPLSPAESRDRELKTGCIKVGLNSGADLDAVAAYCSCIIDTVAEGMSEADSEEYYRVAAEDGPAAASELPQYLAVSPQPGKCQIDAEQHES